MPREVTYTANRCGPVSPICSVALAYASDHVTTRNPFSPFRRIIGSGSRPRALKSCALIPESDDTSLRRSGSSAEAVFKRISSRRTMQRWTPSWVQSLRPTVPSAHPSQTPCCRIRQAKGSWSRFSQRTRSISAYWFGLCSVGSRGITEAQSDGFQPMLHAPALCGLNKSRSDLTPIVAVCPRRIARRLVSYLLRFSYEIGCLMLPGRGGPCGRSICLQATLENVLKSPTSSDVVSQETEAPPLPVTVFPPVVKSPMEIRRTLIPSPVFCETEAFIKTRSTPCSTEMPEP